MLYYQIQIKGVLDQEWHEWFAPLTISHRDDGTQLAGYLTDQAQLYGMLEKLQRLGLLLTSLTLMEPPA